MKLKLKPFDIPRGTAGFSDQNVADLLVSAFEGGSNYWIERCDIVSKGGIEFGSHDQGKDDYYPWIILAVMGSGELRIHPVEDDKTHTLSREKLQHGLDLMANKYPRHWADFVTDHADATTGDVFLQLALLGDIVYG